jgi:osmoprotectant transport system permease protein
MANGRNNAGIGSWIATIAVTAIFVYLIFDMRAWGVALQALFPSADQFVYPRATLAELMKEHVLLVIASSILAIGIGVPAGVLVTRRGGRHFLDVVNDLTSLGQTIPPVAVLALIVPVMGFGFKPTVVALFLYSILPIVRNTISGLEGVPPDLVEAARGMGMTNVQILFRVEIPLAITVIMAGIRISVVINVGTATVGAVIGAGGLGVPIVAGLVRQNPAFVLEGAATAALFAVIADQLLARLESSLSIGLEEGR